MVQQWGNVWLKHLFVGKKPDGGTKPSIVAISFEKHCTDYWVIDLHYRANVSNAEYYNVKFLVRSFNTLLHEINARW